MNGSLGISVNINTRRLLEALERAPRTVQREIRLGQKEVTRDIQKRVTKEHRVFKSQSGTLEKSNRPEVSTDGFHSRVFSDSGKGAPYNKYVLQPTGVYAGHSAFGKNKKNKGFEGDPVYQEVFDSQKEKVKQTLKEAIERGCRMAFAL